MSAFEDLKEIMDAQVDRYLGDSITYKRAGVALEQAPGDPTLPAFLVNLTDDGGISGVSPLQNRWQLKVAKRFLPGGPKMGDLVTAPKLGNAWYQPGASAAGDDGAYYVMDLQLTRRAG